MEIPLHTLTVGGNLHHDLIREIAHRTQAGQTPCISVPKTVH